MLSGLLCLLLGQATSNDWVPGTFGKVPTRCLEAAARPPAGGNKKRIALVLRAQAFRDYTDQTAVSSCCAQSLVAQRSVYYAHELMVKKMEFAGYSVDIFGGCHRAPSRTAQLTLGSFLRTDDGSYQSPPI